MIQGVLDEPKSNYDTSVMNGTAGKIQGNSGIRFKNIPLKFDIETLDLLLAFAFDDTNVQITRAALINLRTLVNMCNTNLYRTNQGLKTRLEFLKLILEARLDTGLANRKIILNYAMERIDQKELVREEILPEINRTKLNGQAVQHLNLFIADRLMNGYILAYQGEIFKAYDDLESGNYSTLRDFVQRFKHIITDLIYDIRNSENFQENLMTIDLSSGFENVIKQLVQKLKDPKNKLKTGSQAVNMLLNGGFEGGRSYLFYGLPGIGKSILLLNICIWIMNHNEIIPNDPSKRPAVLYITQENSLAETIERIFNMLVTGDDIRNYTPEEVANLLRTKGGLSLKTKYDIDLIVQYYDDKEISTLDFYSIIDDIEDTGREVIALVHDYIERIWSSMRLPELRLELAAITNDYSTLAKRKSIPVIGAGQINRKGSDAIDMQMESNRKDLVRFMGKGTLSESWAALKNLDGAFTIHREEDEDGNEFITINKIKFRGKKAKKKKNMFDSYVAHPLDPDNGAKLMDDLHLDKPLSRVTLYENEEADIKKKTRSLRDRKPLKPKEESIEEVEEDQQMNFKVVEEAIRMRQRIEEKNNRIPDQRAEKKFEEVFSSYNQTGLYVRNPNGYIRLTRKVR